MEVENMTTQLSHIQFQYSHTIGRHDQLGQSFREPVALARGQGDLIYVVNRADEYRPDCVRVSVCTIGEEYLIDFGQGALSLTEQLPRMDGSLVWPSTIALDSQWNVYVADEWLNRVFIFTKDGDYLSEWGTAGHGQGEISGPSGLAFDKDDGLYLVDTGNHRVQKFTKDGSFLLAWGGKGSAPGQFNEPWGIDVDRNGLVYVADWRNDRIQKFSSQGQFLGTFGDSGSSDGQFNRPSDVAVDKDGIIYVADWLNNRLQVFDPDGQFVTKKNGDATVSKWAKEKLDANPDMWQAREVAVGMEREKLFRGPAGVEVDDDNRIFVIESGRSRIQVYRKLPTYFNSPRL